MKEAEHKRFSELIEIAQKAGATAARILPSRQVVIDESNSITGAPSRAAKLTSSFTARMSFGPSTPPCRAATA